MIGLEFPEHNQYPQSTINDTTRCLQQDVYNKMFTTRCLQQDVYLTKISQFTDTIVVHQYITTFDVTMDNTMAVQIM